jgi:hypothetical protein
MEDGKDWHPVIKKNADKGELMVDEIRNFHIKHNWNVDYRNVRANGVDLVVWRGTEPDEPIANKKGYPHFLRIYKIYEITNWNKNGWLSKKRLGEMIFNLNSEETKIHNQHPDYLVFKLIRLNYLENFRKIGFDYAQRIANENFVEIGFGKEIVLEEDERIVEGWKD